VLRHGESEGNIDKTLFERLPDYEHSLTPKGRAQAREAGRKLAAMIGDESVYFQVSPYRRTRETLKEILRSFVDVEECCSPIMRSRDGRALPARGEGAVGAGQSGPPHKFLGEEADAEVDVVCSPLGGVCSPLGGVCDANKSPAGHATDKTDTRPTEEGGGGSLHFQHRSRSLRFSETQRENGVGHASERGDGEAEGDGEICYLRCRSESLCNMLETRKQDIFVWPHTARYKVREDARLREQEFGNFQDPDQMRRSLKDRSMYGPFWYRFEHGESGGDVWDRVSDWWASMFRDMTRLSVKNYVIVTHGITQRCLCMYYFKWSVEEFQKIMNPDNCEIWELRLGANYKYHLISDVVCRNGCPVADHMRDPPPSFFPEHKSNCPTQFENSV
jgi:broad specificity phosphatase PhoE